MNLATITGARFVWCETNGAFMLAGKRTHDGAAVLDLRWFVDGVPYQIIGTDKGEGAQALAESLVDFAMRETAIARERNGAAT